MKMRIVSNGKSGGRAFEIIRKRFPAGWIIMPFPGRSARMNSFTDEIEKIIDQKINRV